MTPTGAAIAATAADEWGALPPLTLEAVGYGAGTHDFPTGPTSCGSCSATRRAAPRRRGRPARDEPRRPLPELVPDAVERCFAAGALDVWTAPVQMKKGRPGVVLSALARPGDERAVARALLEETSALGVRVARLGATSSSARSEGSRSTAAPCASRSACLDGRVVNVAPEHDDCAALAAATGGRKVGLGRGARRAPRTRMTPPLSSSAVARARERGRRVLGRRRLVARRRARGARARRSRARGHGRVARAGDRRARRRARSPPRSASRTGRSRPPSSRARATAQRPRPLLPLQDGALRPARRARARPRLRRRCSPARTPTTSATGGRG